MLRRDVMGAKVQYNYNITFYFHCHIENLQVTTFVKKKGAAVPATYLLVILLIFNLLI
jgi:hypothetical protein